MKKDRITTTSMREIKGSYKRFLSLLLMALLGVGFYAGITAASPDMTKSLDTYLDNQNVYDIEVISTLGLTNDDITVLSKFNGVDAIAGSYSQDTLVRAGNDEFVVKAKSITKDINTVTVTAGRLPVANNEVAVEQYLLDDTGYKIGDRIAFTDTDTDTNTNTNTNTDTDSDSDTDINTDTDTDTDTDSNADTDTFKETNLTIVGAVKSPLYFSNFGNARNRGNTNLGTGIINYYVYVPSSNFDSDYYTEIYLTVDQAKAVTTSSEDYKALIQTAVTQIESIQADREQAGYDRVYDKALVEINDKADEAYTVLNDAKIELDRAKAKLNDAKEEIAANKNKIDQALDSYGIKASEIDPNITEVNANIAKLENALKVVDPSSPEYPTYTAQLASLKGSLTGLLTLKQTVAQINTAEASYNDGLKEYQDGWQEYVSNKEKADKEIADAREELSTIDHAVWYVQDRTDSSGYNEFVEDTASVANLGKVFPVVFYIIAILISLISMTRMVEEDRTEIGTLKALGFSNSKIMFKYILYSALATIFGGMIGMVLGFILIPTVIWNCYAMMFYLPKFIIAFDLKYSLIGLMITFVCICGTTILTAYKELRNVPASLMRPKAPKGGRRVFLENIRLIWNRISFSNKVTIRNLFRYRKRVIMTVVGIIGCTSLILTGFGLKDAISGVVDRQFTQVFMYDEAIYLKSDGPKTELLAQLNQDNRITALTESKMDSGTLKNKNSELNVAMVIPADDRIHDVIRLKDFDSDKILDIEDNKIILSDKTAELINAKVGDTITLVDSDDMEHHYVLQGTIENYVNNYVYMNKKTYESTIGAYKTNVIYLNTTELTSEQEDALVTELLKSDEISSVTSTSSTIDKVNNMLKSLDYVVLVLIVSSAILSFVVLYNLSNINISERQREIATLKVLGFYDREVDNYITKENIILTTIGIALGLIGGNFLTLFVITTCEIDNLRFVREIGLNSYLFASLLTIAFTVIVNIITHFSLKKIDMIESLKSVE